MAGACVIVSVFFETVDTSMSINDAKSSSNKSVFVVSTCPKL